MNEGKKTGPGDMPLWSIVRSLTTGQFYGILGALVGLFAAGYVTGQWASSTGHERALAAKDDAHRLVIAKKDQIISQRDSTISGLEDEAQTAQLTGQEAMQVASAADRTARAYRAKTEFLDRYLSYIEDPSHSGTMHKLFVDHVCVLWRETQRDIHSIESDRITLQHISQGLPLSPAAIEAFAAVGIDPSTIDEYRQLNQRRSQIQPKASRFPGGSQEAAFRRLQQLEQRIGNAVRKATTTKTVTFFDGSRYIIPQPIANDVHRRSDCQS